MLTVPLNIPVFTTRFVVSKHSEITHVTHDEDGYWQFLSDDGAIESAAMLISLEEIIAIDSSVQEVLVMEEGFEANRETKKDKWVITKQS
jgi:hypothetical protein